MYVEGTKGSPGGSLRPVCEHLQPYQWSHGRIAMGEPGKGVSGKL